MSQKRECRGIEDREQHYYHYCLTACDHLKFRCRYGSAKHSTDSDRLLSCLCHTLRPRPMAQHCRITANHQLTLLSSLVQHHNTESNHHHHWGAPWPPPPLPPTVRHNGQHNAESKKTVAVIRTLALTWSRQHRRFDTATWHCRHGQLPANGGKSLTNENAKNGH